jgi:hypothetical protein
VPVELEPHVLHDEGPDLVVNHVIVNVRAEPLRGSAAGEGINVQNRIVSSPDVAASSDGTCWSQA